MSPKEKATQLVNDFKPLCPAWEFSNTPEADEIENGKSCAIIAVDEILEAFDYPMSNYPDRIECGGNLIGGKEYYTKVKEEINKL